MDRKHVLDLFGSRILLRRKALGMTQEELEKRMRLSRASITNIEAGRQNITLLTLCRLAAALECTPAELVRLPEDS